MRYIEQLINDVMKFLRGLEELRMDFGYGRKTVDARDMSDFADSLASDCRRVKGYEEVADVADELEDLKLELERAFKVLNGRTRDATVRNVIERVGEALNRLVSVSQNAGVL